MTVHHLLEAELEILDAVSFCKARARDLAESFYDKFKKAREEIAAFPEFWGAVAASKWDSRLYPVTFRNSAPTTARKSSGVPPMPG